MDQVETVNLTIPFLGFYGNWAAPAAIDAFDLTELKSSTKTKAQFIVNAQSGSRSSVFLTSQGLPLPIVGDALYFAPTYGPEVGSGNLYYADMAARIAPLRNIEKLEFSIVDGQTDQVLRVLREKHQIRKLSRLYATPSYRYCPEGLWDGLIDGQPAKSGYRYVYQMKAWLNFRQADQPVVQTFRYPIYIDHAKPELIELSEGQSVIIQDEGKDYQTVHFKVQD